MALKIHPICGDISQTNDEFAGLETVMYDAVRTLHAKVVLETGTSVGNSTRIWSQALKQTGGEVWTIDIAACPQDTDRPNIHYILGSSVEVPWDRPVDILFLDSDHRYTHVVQELARFTPFIRPGGKLMLHDYLNDGTQPGGGVEIRCATEEWAATRHLPIVTYPLNCRPGDTPWGLGVIDLPS